MFTYRIVFVFQEFIIIYIESRKGGSFSSSVDPTIYDGLSHMSLPGGHSSCYLPVNLNFKRRGKI